MNENKRKCTKFLIESNFDTPSVLYGIILEETSDFLVIKTAKKIHNVRKDKLISFSETNLDFKEDLQ